MEQKIMKALAKKIDDAFEKEYEELNEAGKEFSPQLDGKLLEAAKFYDKQYAAGQKKRKSRQILQKAAVFLLIFLSVNTLAIGTSHAYRQFVFQVFENKENHSIHFHDRTERDMIGSWKDWNIRKARNCLIIRSIRRFRIFGFTITSEKELPLKIIP